MRMNGMVDETREALIKPTDQDEEACSPKQQPQPTNSNMKKYIKLLKYIFIAIIIYLSLSLLSRKEVINVLSSNVNLNEPYFSLTGGFDNNNDKTNLLRCNPLISSNLSFKVNLNNVLYPRSTLLFLNKSINFSCLNSDSKSKKILYWNAFFDKKDFSFGLGYKTPLETHECPVTNCELINEKSRLAEADLVLVHMRDVMDDIPAYRPAHQRWVFVLYESPVHASDFTHFNGVFNYTSTYEIDSDFPGFYESYSTMRWEKNEKFDVNSLDYLKKKNNFAVAVISNCGGTSKRLDYIKELQQYISVNIFGKCGTPCPSVSSFEPRLTNCKEIVAYEYKFYFAFENSVCKDYITEKFFQILSYPIIPVVLGGGYYDYYIPKSGYINVHDFSTPKELADYLKYLDSNVTAYNSYFEWKNNVKFENKHIEFSPICDMCIKLHLESHFGIEKKIINDLDEKWNKKTKCKSSQIHTVKAFDFDKN